MNVIKTAIDGVVIIEPHLRTTRERLLCARDEDGERISNELKGTLPSSIIYLTSSMASLKGNIILF